KAHGALDIADEDADVIGLVKHAPPSLSSTDSLRDGALLPARSPPWRRLQAPREESGAFLAFPEETACGHLQGVPVSGVPNGLVEGFASDWVAPPSRLHPPDVDGASRCVEPSDIERALHIAHVKGAPGVGGKDEEDRG